MLTQEQRDEAKRVIGTSASDCETGMILSATTSPVSTLATVAETLHYMNANGIEKISHRKALMKAGRKALNVLGVL
ncbi:hypothetical protein BKP64_10765 [Marinobacter salinus]|uniref:Uncharacterized protein n=1 Tax=Marinobacter salinus TaxID=1874317 RepID=A0A1D9GLY6_9GAMM|nr:hypothetical protein [Marinobacter salinus]AOY88609.1 hypothetical protein BKP64_10765 [Marinobacter salinus]